MNIVDFQKATKASSASASPVSIDDLLESLRLHDQMLSCLSFVLEKATNLHPNDSDFEPLYASVELISSKRKNIVEALGAGQGSQTENRR